MKPPDNCIGADLFWWQERTDLHTLITIRGGIGDQNRLGPEHLNTVYLTFALFDTAGLLQATWQKTLHKWQTLFVNSHNLPELSEQGIELQEGVLAVFVSTESSPPEELKKYRRLYSLVDWYSMEGELVSLHNDQSVRNRQRRIDFTEVVLLETESENNYLVILNGPEWQKPNSLSVEIKNHRNETRTAVYQPAMPPFSLHKLHLNQLFPELTEFCNGGHVTLAGSFDCQGIYIRPYVMTQGLRLSGYHGGDVYQWDGIPRFIHKGLGRGEVNPMVALHNQELTTTVNLLNTHGDLEADYWVDARLYDQAGRLIAEREHWLPAKRHQLSRGKIADLLPDPKQTFTGHLALNFSADDKTFYPRRLQALMEYRTAHNVARVMAWSDVWNGSDRLKSMFEKFGPNFHGFYAYGAWLPPAGVVFRCYYRMWFKPPIVSYLSITNCGVTPDYDRTITYRVQLENGRGDALTYEGSLPPQGTDFGSIDYFFPEIGNFLKSQPVALAVVESEADLAVMHLTHHRASGIYSAEHFMDAGANHQGRYYPACGS